MPLFKLLQVVPQAIVASTPQSAGVIVAYALVLLFVAFIWTGWDRGLERLGNLPGPRRDRVPSPMAGASAFTAGSAAAGHAFVFGAIVPLAVLVWRHHTAAERD